MTVFGNRDFAPTDTAEPPQSWAVPERDWAPRRDAVLPPARDTRRVVITATGGEEIEIGRVDGRERAVELARELIREVARAEEAGAWPEIGDRFVRPGAIVSVDVQRSDEA